MMQTVVGQYNTQSLNTFLKAPNATLHDGQKSPEMVSSLKNIVTNQMASSKGKQVKKKSSHLSNSHFTSNQSSNVMSGPIPVAQTILNE